MEKPLSYEYIRGLVEGEGCFTFSTSFQRLKNGNMLKRKIPAFSISMHERDEELLKLVRDTLGLKNKVYNYNFPGKDGYKRGRRVFLIVREIESMRNIIVPLFYKRLRGNKGKQFAIWLEEIGKDPNIPLKFRFIYKLHKCGFYDKNPTY